MFLLFNKGKKCCIDTQFVATRLLKLKNLMSYCKQHKTTWVNKAHFIWGPRSIFLGTNLDSFEANWILELDPTLDPSLHLDSPNHEVSFEVLFGSKPIDFPSKKVSCRFSLNLPLFGLGPSSKVTLKYLTYLFLGIELKS